MAEKFGNKYRIPPARKPNWDYGRNATYFITICTQNREHFFGKIISGIDDGCANRTDVAVQTLHATSPSAPIVQTLPYRRCMQRLHPHQSYRRCRTDVACNVSTIGQIANDRWYEIPAHFPFVTLGAFVVMPNHIHGILIIGKNDGGSADNQSMDNGFVGQSRDDQSADSVQTLHAESDSARLLFRITRAVDDVMHR